MGSEMCIRDSSYYVETGSFYVFKAKQLHEPHITEGLRGFAIDRFGIDLDTLDDWKKAEILYKNKYYPVPNNHTNPQVIRD